MFWKKKTKFVDLDTLIAQIKEVTKQGKILVEMKKAGVEVYY
jgi:hypothetical protein